MFFPGSRYANSPQYVVQCADGSTVQAVQLPAPGPQLVRGWYRRTGADRLDQIAARFLGDATMFWRLCDASGAVVPDALAAHDLVGVPIDAPVGG
jgi:hypothetical protein